MNSEPFGAERQTRTLLAWQLALLRFAVTLDNNDRLAVLAIARELDRFSPNGDDESDFSFFRRTSAELCTSIADPGDTGSHRLHQYLMQIDDERLKRSFAAAIGYHWPGKRPVRKSTRRNDDLWRGLAPLPSRSRA
ncbi:MAG TPA: hypothetical protein VHB49_04575 [Bradyrhizobium sp.]|nr:hypothetical protein [Bradyrhizobium sp.]